MISVYYIKGCCNKYTFVCENITNVNKKKNEMCENVPLLIIYYVIRRGGQLMLHQDTHVQSMQNYTDSMNSLIMSNEFSPLGTP